MIQESMGFCQVANSIQAPRGVPNSNTLRLEAQNFTKIIWLDFNFVGSTVDFNFMTFSALVFEH